MFILKIHFARTKMKTMCPLLVIAAACCFAPAMSNVIRDDKDEKSCLETAMSKDTQAAVPMMRLMCTFLESKDIPAREKVVKAIENLQDFTNCTTKDLFGPESESPEQVAMDEDDVLSDQMISMNDLLKESGVPLPVAICIALNNIVPTESVTETNKGEAGQENKRTTRQLLGGGSKGGLLGGLLGGGANGGLLGGLLDGGANGGLLGGLLGGGANSGLQGGGANSGLLGGLLGGGANSGLLGGLLGGGASSGLLGGLLGGGANSGLLGGLLGGGANSGLLRGLLGGLLGGGNCNKPGQNGGLLGGVTGTLKGLTGINLLDSLL